MWSRQQIRDLVDARVLVADGAMGTEIYAQGVPFEQSFDALNLTRPDIVRRIHRSYVDAGADLIETNTFGANRYRLEKSGFEARVAEINAAGVRLARECANARPPQSRPLVAASMGPIGRPLVPIGRVSEDDARDAFVEQIHALADADPDLLILETFGDLRECLVALDAVRAIVPDAAVIAMTTFTDEGKTLLGHKPVEVVRRLTDAGADLVGANCSVGPQGLEEVVERMLSVPDVRLCVQPNAGLPRLVGGRYVYVTSEDYLAEWALRMATIGVRIIGGCCGTKPLHVRAIRTAIGNRAPARVTQARAFVELEAERSTPAPVASQLQDKLTRRAFVVSVELDPPRGVNPSALIAGAVACKQAGIDAINIADSPLATARMSPLALAVGIQRQVDIDVILHVSCRDRNVLALQSECMGAHALDIRHILCVTGDPPTMGDYPNARGVFEIDSIGLVGLLARLNGGQDLAGKPLKYRTDFRIACAVNPTAEDLASELDRFARKLDAGAQFAMTQPLYDVADLDRFLDNTKPAIPILVGVLPLRNARHAEFIHNEVPGMRIPKAVRDRMRAAGDRGPEEGVRIAREFLALARERVAGAYVMPPFNRFEMAIDVVRP